MENNLESYLAAIEAQLNDVPAARRTAFIDEISTHLHAMFEAKRADGSDTATAWLHSMREFGEPEKVGRDLLKQWVDSGKMETEGAPLSLGRKLRMFALPVIVCVMAYSLLTWMRAPEHNASWHVPVLTALAFGSLIFGISSEVRKRGGWKPSTIFGCVGALIILSNASFNLDGYESWGGEWRSWGMPAFVLLYVTLHSWLRKREVGNRPWQFSALYKTNPIAAEQTYRLGPLVGLAMGTTMGCIGILSMASQFFGWPLAFFMCAVSISIAVVYGCWRIK